jgi:hypothetical protein
LIVFAQICGFVVQLGLMARSLARVNDGRRIKTSYIASLGELMDHLVGTLAVTTRELGDAYRRVAWPYFIVRNNKNGDCETNLPWKQRQYTKMKKINNLFHTLTDFVGTRTSFEDYAVRSNRDWFLLEFERYESKMKRCWYPTITYYWTVPLILDPS